MANDEANEAAETKRKGPKGWWVNPPDEIKQIITERCEESLRTPEQEVVWILRDWYRKVYQTQYAKQEAPATRPQETTADLSVEAEG